MTKRKDERRELLKEDEFLSLMERAVRYAQNNTKQVLIWVLGFVLLLGVIVGTDIILDWNRESSAKALYMAEKILNTEPADENAELKYGSEKERDDAALAELDKVISAHSGSIREQALVMKVQVLNNLGRQDETQAVYQQMTEMGGTISFLGYMGSADYFRGTEKYDEAIAQYDKALAKSELKSYSSLIKYRKAECFQAAGQNDKAIAELEEVVFEFEDVDAAKQPPIFTKVKTLLDELKGSSNKEESAS